MMASIGFLSVMVTLALVVTILTPVILLVLWTRDWLRKQLW